MDSVHECDSEGISPIPADIKTGLANNMDIIGPILAWNSSGTGGIRSIYLRGCRGTMGAECSNGSVECFVYDESGGADGDRLYCSDSHAVCGNSGF